jgi:hypothetical protein
MKQIADRPTRVAADLLEAAAYEGERSSRSAKQQLDYWARVGRAFTAGHTVTRVRIEQVIAGETGMASLTSDEQAVANAEVNATLSANARTLHVGELLAERGITTVALDDDGRLIRHYPDGRTEALS